AQKVWIYTDRTVDEATFERGLNELLVDVGVAFLRDVESLTATQLNFLKAFTDGVREFTSSVTLRDYHLGASSNIARIRTALEQKEILDFFGKEPEFVDPLFELWFKRNFK
ncbi:MAG: ATP-binding protein, partial [Anaerolineae bacterium]|nr:ATP-binding protein [Anaerolineae bacterium]